jgi:hypothetical protein
LYSKNKRTKKRPSFQMAFFHFFNFKNLCSLILLNILKQ